MQDLTIYSICLKYLVLSTTCIRTFCIYCTCLTYSTYCIYVHNVHITNILHTVHTVHTVNGVRIARTVHTVLYRVRAYVLSPTVCMRPIGVCPGGDCSRTISPRDWFQEGINTK